MNWRVVHIIFDGLYTTYRIPTLTSGLGFAKLNLKTEIKPNSISYIGHFDIILREKKSNDEISAGGNRPFVDQYIAGFSSGTFDVVVEDKFDEDMKSFISEYPALQKVKVEKSILPQSIKPPNDAVVTPQVEEPVTPKEAVVAPKVEEPVAPKEVVVAPKVEEHVIPKEVVVAPKVKEPVAPKEAVLFAAVAADDLAQVNSKKSDWVEFYTGKMGNVTLYKKVTIKKIRRNVWLKRFFLTKVERNIFKTG